MDGIIVERRGAKGGIAAAAVKALIITVVGKVE